MKKQDTYNFSQISGLVLMIFALLWLTISTPFAYASYQEHIKHDKLTKSASSSTGDEDESTNPFGNNTEEKMPNENISLSEEYIHSNNKIEYFSLIIPKFYNCEKTSIYIAFHGEILVPPPITA
jgi:hypothetical protein